MLKQFHKKSYPRRIHDNLEKKVYRNYENTSNETFISFEHKNLKIFKKKYWAYGWKVHISVNIYHSAEAAEKIFPILVKHSVGSFKLFKFDALHEAQGRVFTIYFINEDATSVERLPSILREIEFTLVEYNILPGAEVQADRKITGSQYLSYRSDYKNISFSVDPNKRDFIRLYLSADASILFENQQEVPVYNPCEYEDVFHFEDQLIENKTPQLKINYNMHQNILHMLNELHRLYRLTLELKQLTELYKTPLRDERKKLRLSQLSEREKLFQRQKEELKNLQKELYENRDDFADIIDGILRSYDPEPQEAVEVKSEQNEYPDSSSNYYPSIPIFPDKKDSVFEECMIKLKNADYVYQEYRNFLSSKMCTDYLDFQEEKENTFGIASSEFNRELSIIQIESLNLFDQILGRMLPDFLARSKLLIIEKEKLKIKETDGIRVPKEKYTKLIKEISLFEEMIRKDLSELSREELRLWQNQQNSLFVSQQQLFLPHQRQLKLLYKQRMELLLLQKRQEDQYQQLRTQLKQELGQEYCLGVSLRTAQNSLSAPNLRRSSLPSPSLNFLSASPSRRDEAASADAEPLPRRSPRG